MIRHTTPKIGKGICYGQADLDLAATFGKEAQNVLQSLPASMDKVYTSPLKRCLQLAKLIPHKKLEEIQQLQEMNFGDWELKPWSDIPKEDLDPWMDNFVNQRVPSGESMKMLADRVTQWYKEMIVTEDRKVAIVTHAGPIRIILSVVNNTPFEQAFKHYQVEYGEVFVI